MSVANVITPGKTVFIVEGPDGGGKTTLAKMLARRTQAMLVHHGSYLDVARGDLAGVYHSSLDPATMRMCNVVLDRSWLSEPIYGAAVRGGEVRLTDDEVSALESRARHLANGIVIKCLPDFETCLEAFASRPREEYLKREEQLRQVWHGYANMKTSLEVRQFVRDAGDLEAFVEEMARRAA